MTVAMASRILADALIHTAVASGPVLIVSLVVGLIIGIVQTTTSVQEQTLSFVPKLIAVFLVIVLLGIPGLTYLAEYTRKLFLMISTMGG
jgi:flagellar biosynthetic protein FliQ